MQAPRKFFLLCLPLAFCGCQTTPAMLAKQELKPVPASLADQLPGDTILYFALPNVPAMRENMRHSTMLKIYREPAMQNFLSGGLELLDEAWTELRAQAAAQGVAPELLEWDTLRSFEAGLSVRAAPGKVNPFAQVPQVQASVRIGLAPGRGNAVFDLLVGMVGEQGLQVVDGPGRRTLIIEESVEEGSPLSVKLHGLDNALLLEVLWGAPGAGRLSDNPAYRRAWHRNATAGTAAFGFFQFHDLAEALFVGLSAEEPAVSELLGEFFASVLQPIEAVSFASGWTSAGSFTNASLDLSENAGEQWRLDPVDRGLAARIPAGATSFTLANSRTGPWMELMMRTLDSVGAFQPEDSPMNLSQILEASVPEVHGWIFGEHRPQLDRALASFGSASYSYTVPTSGLSAESYTFVELSDPEGMSAVLEQLMPRLREVLKASESGMQLKMLRTKLTETAADGSVREVAGPAYYWIEFEFPPELAQIAALAGQSFKPSFGVAPEGWLVFSMNEKLVSKVLKEGVALPEHNILENAAAAKFITSSNKTANALSWSDPRPAATAALGMLSGFIPMLGAMLGEKVQLPVDLADFPEADVFVRNLRTSEAVTYFWLGDYRATMVGNFGFADLFSAFGAIVSLAPPFVGLATSMMHDMEEAFEGPAPLPGEVEF